MDKMFYYRLGQKRGGGGAPVISAEGWGDHSVAFMSDDGATRLTVRGVPNGTTCPDPVESGAISKPIKPMGGGYAYTFAGWTKTLGGEAESNALRNVKADTNLYAVFDASEIMYQKLIDRSLVNFSNDEAESLGDNALRESSNLVSVDAPAAKYVGENAFYSCRKLADVNLPEVTNIGKHSFNRTSALTYVSLPKLTTVGESAFYESGLVSGDFPEVTTVLDGGFSYARSLTSVSLPKATSLGASTFQSCALLSAADFPLVTSIGMSAFNGCTALAAINFPALQSVPAWGFGSCTSLSTADFSSLTKIDGGFGGCSSLATFILRNETQLCTLFSTSPTAFNGTPIEAGTGYIYVPRKFLSDTDSSMDYRRFTAWTNYASQFRALEDFTVDGTTTGALDPAKI